MKAPMEPPHRLRMEPSRHVAYPKGRRVTAHRRDRTSGDSRENAELNQPGMTTVNLESSRSATARFAHRAGRLKRVILPFGDLNCANSSRVNRELPSRGCEPSWRPNGNGRNARRVSPTRVSPNNARLLNRRLKPSVQRTSVSRVPRWINCTKRRDH